MRHSAPDRTSVAVFADTDSRWKWGAGVAQLLEPVAVTYFLKLGPATPTGRQLSEAGVDPARVIPATIADFPQLLAEADPDVVILALPGDACQAAMHALAAQWSRPRRPIVVTGYVGIVYERVVEGVLNRAGCDVLLANSPADAGTFRLILGQYGLDPDAVVTTPLPFLATSRSSAGTHPTTLTFAAQPGVPARLADRKYLVDRLIAHATKFPERHVILKVRGLGKERLTHPEPYPFGRIVDRHSQPLPPNFCVAAGPMSAVLDRTDLLVAVSSTAAIEAIHRDIPAAILTDFGIREDLGNSYFSGSGCLVSFDDLDEAAMPTADRQWAIEHGLVNPPEDEFRARTTALRGAELPPLRPFYNGRRSPAYLPRLLEGHGLTPTGLPLATRRRSRGSTRLIRSLAHTLYRQGVSVVAPILRRMGAS
jgi:hypothetical protein